VRRRLALTGSVCMSDRLRFGGRLGPHLTTGFGHVGFRQVATARLCFTTIRFSGSRAVCIAEVLGNLGITIGHICLDAEHRDARFYQ
jgi:hypothetical protein